MRLFAVAVLLASGMAYAQAGKTCEDLKADIAKKIEANGVKTYTLEIVAADKAAETEGKVVGSCEGGAKKIVYNRGAAAAKPEGETKPEAKPEAKKQ